MKVSTRLILGFGLVLALFAGLTVYNVSSLYELADTNRRTAGTTQRLHLASTELPMRLDELEEFARKYAITGDSAYAARFDEYAASFAEDLESLAAAARDERVVQRVERLQAVWDGFEPRFRRAGRSGRRDTFPGLLLREEGAWPAGLDGAIRSWIGDLRTQTARTARALRVEMNEQAGASIAEARRAERLSWIVSGSALLVALLVAGAVAGSVYRQLVRLTDGTRRIAEGDFQVRLESERDDEFRLLVDHFNSMAERLAEFDEMKRAFLSRISHDLKSPLASMQEALAVLDDGLAGELDPEQRKLVEMSQQNGRRLSKMITKILALARMEEDVGHVRRERGELADVVRRAADDMRTRTAGRPLELRVELPEGPAEAEIDEQLVRQLLDNLLENALRYTPDEGTLRLQLRVLQDDDEVPAPALRAVRGVGEGRLLLLEVADSGPGVPDEEKEGVFDRFERGAKSDGGGGVGLGLTICREVARAHGGEIWVEDAPEGGAAFRVLLPERTREGAVEDRRRPGGRGVRRPATRASAAL